MSLEFARRLANSQPWLDPLADRAQPAVRKIVTSRPQVHDLLDGRWLGVPLHPALTDVPVGSWAGAFCLDVVGGLTGSRSACKAADGALAIGIAGALPAAVTGLSDWRDLYGEQRRIGSMHALLNVVGLGLNIASLAQRARGRRGAGRTLSTLAVLVSGTAAHLGGELSFGLGVRVNQTFRYPRPDEFVAVLDEAAVQDGEMTTAMLDGRPILIARSASGQLCAIAGTCSHLGGPLAEGTREDDVVTCPWHGSRFDLCSGRVREGPAVFAQPRYDSRVSAGRIELRAAQDG